ncbi:MAG TPA: helix-turn-helix transcriptional regulator [Burkholderiaceae bacterium]
MNTFRAIRDRLELTQQAMGDALGMTQGNISFYEKGQTVPPDVAKKVVTLAASLGHEITLDDVYAEPQPAKKRTRDQRAVTAGRRKGDHPKAPGRRTPAT